MKTLEDRIKAAGGAIDMLYHAQTGRYQFPIQPEFTTWMEEQQAWRNGVALMDQSVHMTDLYIKGKDALALVSSLAVNSFANFGRNKAKQLICVSHEGYVIGDAIIFGLEDDEFNIVGRPVLANWVQYHAETGGYDVTVTRDERRLDRPDQARLTYRYEIQGPDAIKLLEKVNEGGPLTTKFFNMGEITIAGCHARTLSHGMGGSQGLEIWGPHADGAKVKAALVEAGAEFGLRLVGSRAYATAAAESGWVPSPLPAIFSGEGMEAYRNWLSANAFEGVSSLGGSLKSSRIEDYYFTPWDLDYGRVIRFDHDFIGRAALERMQHDPQRRKMTLVWNQEDVNAVFTGMTEGDLPTKLMEMPASHYATYPYDRVQVAGRDVGVSISAVYSANERAWISLAVLDPAVAEVGQEVTVIWGEPDGGSRKPNVEPHRQIAVRATVHLWPIHEASRQQYRAQK